MESGFPAFMNQGAAPKPSAACSTGLTVPHMKLLLGAVKVSVAGAATPGTSLSHFYMPIMPWGDYYRFQDEY